VEEFIIQDDGVRLDGALAAAANVSRAVAQRMIEAGLVEVMAEGVRGRKAKASQRLKAGEKVRFERLGPEPAEEGPVPEAIPLDIIFEDASLIVLNKPAGLVVHPAAGHRTATLVNALLHHAGEALSSGSAAGRPGIVHRLDKDTSGVMAVARTDAAQAHLSRQLKCGLADKRYLGLVIGEPREDRGTIDAPLGRHPIERKRMAVVAGGRVARTDWEVRERFGGAALIEFRLHTGRTHQIRVHAARLGHPIAGDATYGGRRWSSLPPKLRPILSRANRQMLHSWRLGLTHPETGERMDFEAPLPADFRTILGALRRSR
jgi:23S rRNA pseudouridine1911/1915/1917 synthase